MRCARSLLKSTIHTIALARLALGIGLLALTPVSAQVPVTIADQLSTDEHLPNRDGGHAKAMLPELTT
jgi:hypothetical protein